MDAFDKLVVKHFPKKDSLKTLMEMVEEQLGAFVPKKSLKEAQEIKQIPLDEFYDYLPKFELTEKIGEFTEEGKNEARKTFEMYMTSLNQIQGLREKINYINSFTSGQQFEGKDYEIHEIMTNITFLRMLSMVIEQFSPSASGFIFEAFLAAILGGRQVTGREGGSLPIQDFMKYSNPKTGNPGQPVSLKLLGPTTDIEGSLYNLVDFIAKNESANKGIEYVVATKRRDDMLDFHSFNIDVDNIFWWMSTTREGITRYFDMKKMAGLVGQAKKQGLISEQEEAAEQRDFTEIKQFIIDYWPTLGIRSPELTMDMSDEDFIDATGMAKRRPRKKYDPELALVPENRKKWDQVSPSFSSPEGDVNQTMGNRILQAQLEADPAKAVATLKKRFERFKIFLNRGVSHRSPLHFPTYVESVLGPEAPEEGAKELTKAAEVKLAKEVASIWNAGQRETWGEIMQQSMSNPKIQFVISPEKMMKHAEHYDAVIIDRSRIVEVMNQYSEQLREKVVPIYTELARLTNELNQFYLADNVNAGPKAAGHAESLRDEVAGAVEEK